jgi:phenylalanyl-tRNA synthetase beta chain
MPTVTLSKKVLEKQIGKKLSLEELKDRISMIGTDLEKIEGDDIVVEIFPNRPDMLSEQGFARALSAFLGVKTGLAKYEVKKAEKNYEVIVDKSVKDIRPFTACAIIKNLSLNDEKIREIIQLQEKLHITFGRHRKKLAIGIYPLEKITLPITYKALKPEEIKFRPLEAEKEMTGKEILQEHETGKEYAHLLEGKNKYPIFVDAKEEILSMPPIINSEKTGRVNEKTKEVFVECSGFDLKVLEQALSIIVTSLSDMGAEIYYINVKYQDQTLKMPNLQPREMKIDINYINKMIGMNYSEKEIKILLEKMNYAYEKGKVFIPSYRTDILHPIDIAEDVAIAYGYENFQPEIPNVSTVAQEDGFEIFSSRVADILVGLGLNETMSYNIVNEENHTKKVLVENNLVKLANALNQDYSAMRRNLYPAMLEIFSNNTSREYPQKIFEIGKTFSQDKTLDTGVKEEENLSVALCGNKVDFTVIKQHLDALMKSLDLKYDIKTENHNSFIEGRTIKILVDKKDIGFLGEIKPQVLENFSLEMPVGLFEINLRKLYNQNYR